MPRKPVTHHQNKSGKGLGDVFYSVVIPVYRAEKSIGRTIDRTISFFETQDGGSGWSFEIILVNDCSPDKSWEIIEKYALTDHRIIAVNLGKNYGQHTANIVGFEYTRGDCVITMDGDLQNPPEEIIKLAEKYIEGYDLVVATFVKSKHTLYRRAASLLMQTINRTIFPAPPGFKHTNFRLIAKSVVQRIIQYRNHYPYTSGTAMMFSSKQKNVVVRHDKNFAGRQSSYNLKSLLGLSWDIVFNYSLLPVKILIYVGFAISFFYICTASIVLIKSFVSGTSVTGWTSLVLLISLSNVFLFVLLAIISKYLAVISQQIRMDRHFFIRDVVGVKR